MTPLPIRIFPLGIALVSLLLTLVMATTIWEGYFPDLDREGLRRRKSYYEKVLRRADVSWKEGLYYKVLDGEPKKP